MSRVKKAPAARIDGGWNICIEFCEHNVSCASGTLFSYLNCSLVFSAVPCSMHLKADYSCPHILFSFRSDSELVCQVLITMPHYAAGAEY